MSDREEYLKDIEEAKKKIELAKKKAEDIKTKVSQEMVEYKRLSHLAIEWLVPKDLDNPKDVSYMQYCIQEVNTSYQRLKDLIDSYEELTRPRSNRESPGTIPLLEEDIEGYEDEIKQIDKEMQRKALTIRLDSLATALESQGDSVVAQAIDKVSDLIEAKYIKEEGHGMPGQPGYKPTLWYMVTPGGKKMLVDQKSEV